MFLWQPEEDRQTPTAQKGSSFTLEAKGRVVFSWMSSPTPPLKSNKQLKLKTHDTRDRGLMGNF